MIGVDIIEVVRVAARLGDKRFLREVYCKGEIEYIEGKKDPLNHYATTFAAKEAVFKAFGLGWGHGTDIEVVRNNAGKPEIILGGALKLLAEKEKIKDVKVSLAFNEGSAIAFAFLEK